MGQWWRDNGESFPHVRRLVIDQDNGPENNSHRTQFMARMVTFADEARIDVRLAYYPPYHSKYNPIERCWAALEKSWERLAPRHGSGRSRARVQHDLEGLVARREAR
jgi:hypothetical protein